MPGIRDVAERAGVSPTTVSLVLNNKTGANISPATRDRVLSAADEVGYLPNPYARALVGSKAPLIKLVYRPHEMYIGNLKGASLLAELGNCKREIMVTDSISGADRDAMVESLLWGRPEAVVFQYVSRGDTLAGVYQGLQREGVRCVIADCWELPDPKLPCDAVTVDRIAGVTLGMEHLLERGHRDIGLVMTDSQFGRHEAYDETLSRHGISHRYVARCDPAAASPERTREARVALSSRDATQRLLRDFPQLTALMCGSDMIALGAMGAAADTGHHVPRDLAVVGFHGEPWTELLPVPLTTVAEPVSEICSLATDILCARLKGDSRPWLRARIAPHLVVRKSSEEDPQCEEASR